MKAYDESLKVLWDNYSIIETAKEEGREEGREKGRVERDIEIVKAMKSKGYSDSEIIALTGLSIEEIEKLAE